jgi:hypothetical protein
MMLRRYEHCSDKGIPYFIYDTTDFDYSSCSSRLKMSLLSTSVPQATGFWVKVSAIYSPKRSLILYLLFQSKFSVFLVMGFMHFNDKYTHFPFKNFSASVMYFLNFKDK